MNMFVKSTALASMLALGTAAAVSAETYIPHQGQLMQTNVIELGTVTTDTAGFVAIYDYRLGEFGELLGIEPVNAGANSAVRVNLGVAPEGNVAAVVFAGPVTDPMQAAAWEKIDIESNAEAS